MAGNASICVSKLATPSTSARSPRASAAAPRAVDAVNVTNCECAGLEPVKLVGYEGPLPDQGYGGSKQCRTLTFSIVRAWAAPSWAGADSPHNLATFAHRDHGQYAESHNAPAVNTPTMPGEPKRVQASHARTTASGEGAGTAT